MKIEIQQTISGVERIGKDVQMNVNNQGVLIAQQSDDGPDEVALTWMEAGVLAACIEECLKQVGKLKFTQRPGDKAALRQKPGPKPAECPVHGKPYKECGCVRLRKKKGGAPEQAKNPNICQTKGCTRLNGHPGLHSFDLDPSQASEPTDFALTVNKHRHLPCGVKDQGDHGVDTPFEYVWNDPKTHGTQVFPRCAVHSKIYPNGEEISGFEKHAASTG